MLRSHVYELKFSSGDEEVGSGVTSGSRLGHSVASKADIFKMSGELPVAFVERVQTRYFKAKHDIFLTLHK